LYGHSKALARVVTPVEKVFVENHQKITVGKLDFTVLFTPGHTDSHIALFEEKSRTLIAGDHVVGFGSAVLDSKSGGDMYDYFKSTHLMLELNPRIVLPAHGQPNFSPIELLNYYLTHRQQRENAILECYKSGKVTLDEIVRTVYTDTPPQMWPAAKHNIELHLRKLQKEGRIESCGDKSAL